MHTYQVLGQKVIRTLVELTVEATDLDDAYEQASELGIEVDRVDLVNDLKKTIKEKLNDQRSVL